MIQIHFLVALISAHKNEVAELQLKACMYPWGSQGEIMAHIGNKYMP